MKTFTAKGYTATVIVDDKAAEKFGIPGFIPCAFIDETDEGPVITTTSGFYKLTKATQEIILTHEIGHLALGHLKNTNPDEMTINARLEAEADLWACEIIGFDAFDKAIFEASAVTLDELAAAGYTLTDEIREQARTERNARIANRKALVK
jgi:hypothetical protein